MKIIKYKKKDNSKYEVFLEDGEKLDVFEDVILDNNLLYKNNIDGKLLSKIIEDNDVYKIYNSCVKYISIRVRSTKEIRDYLRKKDVSLEEEEKIINKLKDCNLLNDEYFTECFIKDKLNLTNWGEHKIKNKLLECGIDNNIIDKYWYLFDKELLRKKIDKIIVKTKNSSKKNNTKQKLYVNLMNLGYSKELIWEELNNNF